MSSPGEIAHHVDDFIEMTVDIEDCPLAELLLTEISDVHNFTKNDDYLATLRKYIEQQLEDTSWLDDRSTSPLFEAGFSTFTQHKAHGGIVSLRKPAFHRLIEQTLRNRETDKKPVSIPIFIRFMVLDGSLPIRSNMAATVPSVIGGTMVAAVRGRNEKQDVDSPGEMLNIVDLPAINNNERSPCKRDNFAEESPIDPTQTTPRARTSFCGISVDVLPTHNDDAPHSYPGVGAEHNPRRPRTRLDFDDDRHGIGGGTPRTQQSNRIHTSNADLTYGTETYRDYMSTEVKYKDFCKTTIRTFDSSKQDSFIHR